MLFEAAEFMYVNIDRQIVANLRILYNECNKCDVGLLCFLHLVDNKFAASCQQPWCKYIVKNSFILKYTTTVTPNKDNILIQSKRWIKMLSLFGVTVIVFFNNFQQVSKHEIALSMVFTDLMHTVYEAHRQQAWCKMCQACKIRNLHQLCGFLVAHQCSHPWSRLNTCKWLFYQRYKLKPRARILNLIKHEPQLFWLV